MAKDEKYQKKRVRFMYIFENIQKDFIASFDEEKNQMTLCSDGTLPFKV